jgi:hypothetical protein
MINPKDAWFITGEKYFVDAVSILTMVGALSNYLPHVAALFTIVWTGIRIYETDTIQRMVKRKPTE